MDGSGPAVTVAGVPFWYDRVVAALLSAALGFGAMGLLWARLGFFAVAPVVFLGAALAYTVYLGLAAPGARARGGSAPALAALAFVGMWVAANLAVPGERLLADSETAVAVHAARELAGDGDLVIEPQAPFGAAIRIDAPGLESFEGGVRAVAAGVHTALLGAATWVGDGLMYRAGVLMGGLALLAFYGLAARLLRTVAALAVTVALGVNAAFVLLARDVSPAPLALAFATGGLALLLAGEDEPIRLRAGAAGALLGSTALVDLDWIVLMVPVALWAAAEIARPADSWVARRRRTRHAVAVGAGYAITAVAALALTLDDDAALGVRTLVLVGITGAILAGAWLARGRSLRPPVAESKLAVAVAVLVVVAGGAAAVVRPLVFDGEGPARPEVAIAQAFEGDPIDPARTYAESSARWPGWYLGPVTPAAGLVGLALMAAGMVLGRERPWLPVLLVGGVATVAWLWRPGESPVQPWAAGRLLPLTFPLLLLAAGWTADLLWRERGRLKEVTETISVAILVGVVALPVLVTTPLLQARPQAGLAASLDELCAALGSSAAVLVVAERSEPAAVALAPAIGRRCEVPAAWTPELGAEQRAALAARADQVQRRLEVLAVDGSSADRLATVRFTSPEPRVTAPPLGNVSLAIPITRHS